MSVINGEVSLILPIGVHHVDFTVSSVVPSRGTKDNAPTVRRP